MDDRSMDDRRFRVCDADRERVVAALQPHVGAGRLSLEEFSERAEAAYRARTMDELDVLTRDLPVPAPRPPRASPRGLVSLLVAVAVLLVAVVVVLAGTATVDAGGMLGEMGRMCG